MKACELFQRLSGTHVALLPNEGNCGDGLIYMGFKRLCEDHFVSYTTLLDPRPASGGVLLVLACGNLCEPFHHQAARIRRYVGSFRETYLLPCSIDPRVAAVAEMLETLPSNVTIFCRERFSLAKIRPYLRNGNDVHLDDDLALKVDFEPWQRAGSGTLYAFRTDLESCGFPLPPGNMDVSLWGGSLDGELLLRTLSEYAVIHTDRAHVGICAALLGKETHLYPNNYHKVRGIYEQSLGGRTNVSFHATFPSATGSDGHSNIGSTGDAAPAH